VRRYRKTDGRARDVSMISKTKPENFKEKFHVVSCFIECGSEILLLHRHDSKPQGGTWGVPAGKVDKGEDLNAAIAREIMEELGLVIAPNAFSYFNKFFVRYPEYDFVYHIFHLPVKEKIKVNLNPVEHKDHNWKNPSEALKLNLIQDEDFCIKAFYKI
jgi:8-oxo-dGTP pyrophosphatase MutT (NUDIX family)